MASERTAATGERAIGERTYSRQSGTAAGGGPALFRLVRFWSRRWATGAVGEVSGQERKVQDVMVLEAVHTAAQAKAEVSVADVAHQLGIDRSGASRFVADAIERGHLRRAASTEDARRAALTVTSAGSDLLAGAHAWQEAAYARLTGDWDPADAARFAHYLRRLASELTDLERDGLEGTRH